MSTTPTPESPEKSAKESVEASDSSERTAKPAMMLPPRHTDDQFYTELARIIGTMFIGLLALMTFLLTVGYSRPHAMFAWSLYASIITFGLSLLAYMGGRFFRVQADTRRWELKAVTDDAKKTKALTRKFETAQKELKVAHVIQQLLFVAAVIAITCLALATAHFFFALAASAAQAAPQAQ
jgi:hypothetical protein